MTAGRADKDAGNVTGCCRLLFGDFVIIIIMYNYHALINALSAHMIHINLNMIFYTHVEHSPTKTIYIKYYTEKQMNTHYTHTHTHTHTAMNSNVYDTDLYCTCLLVHVRAHAHTHTHTR